MQLESLLVVLSPGTIQLFIFGAFPELIHVLYMYLKASGLAPKHFLMQLTINPDIDLVLYSTFLSFFLQEAEWISSGSLCVTVSKK